MLTSPPVTQDFLSGIGPCSGRLLGPNVCLNRFIFQLASEAAAGHVLKSLDESAFLTSKGLINNFP